MPGIVQSKVEAKRHAAALTQAADYVAELARRSELPLTPAEFDERVEAFYAQLDAKIAVSQALVLAVLADEPCPQDLFSAWASESVIKTWRRAEKNPLQVERLNRKIMIRPSAFFAALREHGKAEDAK
jgi:hypothetical protein